MFGYRPDQGVYARGTAFWAITAYAGFAGTRFYYWVQRFDFASDPMLQGEIPVLGMRLTGALVLGVAVFLGLTYLAWRVVNMPKLADLLVDTEAEMKKVRFTLSMCNPCNG